jgi:hypothetical protein
MYRNLASIRETVDLAAAEVLDAALTFLISHGYRTTERTDTSLTVMRHDQTDAEAVDQPHDGPCAPSARRRCSGNGHRQ